MSSLQMEVIAIACLVAASCAIPGTFLVLRGVALMSDAISHAILLGIVAMFIFTHSINPIFLMFGAVVAGILTVVLTEWIIKSKRLKQDAAIGLVFPAFFALGVLGINLFASNVHLDEDAVLLGELAFAPFNRITLFATDIGPVSFWVMLIILLLNIVLLKLFYKEMKVMTFDTAFAASIGVSPVIIHYALMTLVSITAVGAFDAVGSILVVSLMVTPPATAFLLTNHLNRMIIYSVLIGVSSAIFGYGVAYSFDASIAGAMASMTGFFFLVAFFFSPKNGVIKKIILKKQQRIDFGVKMLLVHLLEHEGSALEAQENTFTNLIDHIGWSKAFASQITSQAINNATIIRNGDQLNLTPLGRELGKDAMRST